MHVITGGKHCWCQQVAPSKFAHKDLPALCSFSVCWLCLADKWSQPEIPNKLVGEKWESRERERGHTFVGIVFVLLETRNAMIKFWQREI